jgi:hypothetical protein
VQVEALMRTNATRKEGVEKRGTWFFHIGKSPYLSIRYRLNVFTAQITISSSALVRRSPPNQDCAPLTRRKHFVGVR